MISRRAVVMRGSGGVGLGCVQAFLAVWWFRSSQRHWRLL